LPAAIAVPPKVATISMATATPASNTAFVFSCQYSSLY
jgi:hypothetical protein